MEKTCDFKETCEELTKEQKLYNKTINTLLVKVNEISEQIKEMNDITIVNGGGRHIKFNRAEFYQMVYDRTKFTWNNAKGVLRDVVLITTVIAGLFTLYQLFK